MTNATTELSQNYSEAQAVIDALNGQDHGGRALTVNEAIYGNGVVKPSAQGRFERSLRTSPWPSASVSRRAGMPHLSHPGGWTMMYLLPHIP